MPLRSAAILLLPLLALAACSTRPLSDPLGVRDMMERCEEMAKKGEKPGGFPFMPFFGCR